MCPIVCRGGMAKEMRETMEHWRPSESSPTSSGGSMSWHTTTCRRAASSSSSSVFVLLQPPQPPPPPSSASSLRIIFWGSLYVAKSLLLMFLFILLNWSFGCIWFSGTSAPENQIQVRLRRTSNSALSFLFDPTHWWTKVCVSGSSLTEECPAEPQICFTNVWKFWFLKQGKWGKTSKNISCVAGSLLKDCE